MPKARTRSSSPAPAAGSKPSPVPPPTPVASPEEERQAIVATLQKMGFAAISRRGPSPWEGADLWVRSSRNRSVLPVLVERVDPPSIEERTRRLLERWSQGLRLTATPQQGGSSILVVDSDSSAELASRGMVAASPLPLSLAVSRTRILVHPRRTGEAVSAPHWHRLRLPPRVVLMLATGALVGLAERAEQAEAGETGGAAPIDVEGMFRALRSVFSIDVEGSFGVTREEDAMFLMYQLALKETYAPGDQGASLHELVNNPKGPGARLPWFAI